MLQEEILSQKGLLGREKCEKDGAVGRDPAPWFSLCCLQAPLIDPSLFFSTPYFPRVYIHFTKKSHHQAKMFIALY